jgi:hypothetical protein
MDEKVLVTTAAACAGSSSGSVTDGTSSSDDCSAKVIYGHAVRDAHFLMAPGLVNLNHGSFGCVPKYVAAEQQRLFYEQGVRRQQSIDIIYQYDIPICHPPESHPDRWFRKSFYEYIDISRELIARFVNASPEGLVLVESASTAFNSIVRSMVFEVELRFDLPTMCIL